MRRAVLTAVVALMCAGALWAHALPADAVFDWGPVESSMPGLCGSELEEGPARDAKRRESSCVDIAEVACSLQPTTPEQTVLHDEGCEIEQANAGRKASSSSSSGGVDAALIAGPLAGFVVLASALWVALDARRRDLSAVRGPRTRLGQAIAVTLLWPLFFPLYLLERRHAPRLDAVPPAA